MGFIRKLWRRHKAKARDRRMFMDQGRQGRASHTLEDGQRMALVENVRRQEPG